MDIPAQAARARAVSLPAAGGPSFQTAQIPTTRNTGARARRYKGPSGLPKPPPLCSQEAATKVLRGALGVARVSRGVLPLLDLVSHSPQRPGVCFV